MKNFFDYLINEQQRVATILKYKRGMLPLTDEENQRFDRMQACPRCNEQFTEQSRKVKHHNHRTGKFIDALRDRCNL